MTVLNTNKNTPYTRLRFFSILLSVTFLTSSFTPKDPTIEQGTKAQKVKTIVLDAGHGGHDSGAVGRKSKEKDVALQVTLKLGAKIEKEMPDTKVIYTRTTDVFIPLYQRPAVANEAKAELFISIHCNSGGTSTVRKKNSRGRWVTSKVPNRTAVGTETIVSGFNRLAQQDAAIRENASILLEENYKENYGGFDPNDPSSMIVFQLMKNQYRRESIKLASYMQETYKASGRRDRGVLELSLAVLATAGMPAVLTEIGFISNPDEEDFMLSDYGQKEIVNNLFNAIKTYKTTTDR
ncbi:N-acetylmuramoyl-L-alanine amidase [Sphingobacterium sp. UT-1RO-CII-1]|nr:N-acetylmuramoyl-L-alanine amidase [Sphingobacterium sp. UT-1RO-CII-1]